MISAIVYGIPQASEFVEKTSEILRRTLSRCDGSPSHSLNVHFAYDDTISEALEVTVTIHTFDIPEHDRHNWHRSITLQLSGFLPDKCKINAFIQTYTDRECSHTVCKPKE